MLDLSTIENILKDNGVELYDTETVEEDGRKIFRVYITSENGISLDKCTEITRILSPLLDTDPPVDGHYFFEVSSPGIERKLKKPLHFMRSVGEILKIKTKDKKNFIAKLIDADKEGIVLQTDSEKELFRVKYDEIYKARTYFEW